MLGGDGGAADDEQVDARLDHRLVELLRALRGERAGDRHAARADLGEARGDQIGLIGAEYISCIRAVALSAGSSRISASSGSGSSYRVQRPSRSSTPRPPSCPIAIAVAGETTESIGADRKGMANW